VVAEGEEKTGQAEADGRFRTPGGDVFGGKERGQEGQRQPARPQAQDVGPIEQVYAAEAEEHSGEQKQYAPLSLSGHPPIFD